ncbi:MAG TPA: hypothetical protein VF587_01345 [Solirubrobacteraceae bacterium]|jgi:biopolymer transport protein ExbB/TolQ
MDTGVIVAIVVGAILLIALFAFMSRQAKTKRTEQRRVEARSHREEARVRGARATRAEAEAEERAARAKREQALAEEQAATAQRERRFARSKEQKAAELDPDHDGSTGSDREAERERTQTRR